MEDKILSLFALDNGYQNIRPQKQLSVNYSGVKAIEVIVIDLAVRSVKLNI